MKKFSSFRGTNFLIVGFPFGVDLNVLRFAVIATGSKSSPASRADRLVTFTSFDSM
jgi:hypothetical protein